MKNAYRKKRSFWYNLKNFDKSNIPAYGPDKIILAGFEFVLCDSKCNPKNIFVAVNSFNESQMCYELDNKNIGIMCGDQTKIFSNIVCSILNGISELTYNMNKCNRLPTAPKLDFVNFYASGYNGKFCKTLTYSEIHFPRHPYYPLYIYFMQLFNEMRKLAVEKNN